MYQWNYCKDCVEPHNKLNVVLW